MELGAQSRKSAPPIPTQQSEAVEPGLREAAAEVRDIFEAAALQRARGEIAALALLAVDEDSAIARQLAEPVAEFTEWNMCRISEQTGFGYFAGLAHIEKELSIRLPIFRRDCRHIAAYDVIGNKAGSVDRIVGRAERWCVCQVEAFEVEDGHSAGDRRSKDVGALVHAVFAHDLSAEQAPGTFFSDDLDRHRP